MNPSPFTSVVAAPDSAAGGRPGVHVHTVFSPRAGGLSVRLDLNPDGHCNFGCVYCEVARSGSCSAPALPDVSRMMQELEHTLFRIARGEARHLPGLAHVPPDLLRLGHVALSGQGEPTLSPVFERVLDEVFHLRARGDHGFFRIAVITNSSGFLRADVRRALARLHPRDEVWAKLDAGDTDRFLRINRTEVSWEALLEGIRAAGSERPLVLQTMAPRWKGRFLSTEEQVAFGNCVGRLVDAGTRLQRIQIYSVLRPSADPTASHASLAELNALARKVRGRVRVPVQVY